MNEIIFLVEEAPEGGYIARALGESIFIEADDLESLRHQASDAIDCHFADDKGGLSICIFKYAASQPNED